MNQLLDYLAILAILFFLFKSIQDLEKGLLLGLLIKPLVDTGWDFSIGPLSLIDIHSIFFLWFGYQLIVKNNLFRHMSRVLVSMWFFAHIGLLFLILNSPESGLEGIIKILFFPLALVLLPYYWIDFEKRELLIRYLLIASLFPAVIILLQTLGILPIETIRMTKGLVRMNGFYHDIVTSRIYIVQGLFTLFLIHKTGVLKFSLLLKVFLLMFFFAAGFLLYSKAFIGIICMGLGTYLITNRNIGALLGLIFLLVPLYFIASDSVLPALNSMFVKEVEFQRGDTDNTRQLFSGRGMLWSNYLENFNQSDALTQFLGFHKNDGRTHNEFLRIVILSGLFGLIAYILFFFKLTQRSLMVFFKGGSLSFITVWGMGILLLDAFSVVWGIYPYYLILLIGFITIGIEENKFKTYNQV